MDKEIDVQKDVEEKIVRPIVEEPVDFGWVNNIKWVFIILGWISLTGFGIYLFKSCNEYESGNEVFIGVFFASFLISFFLAGIIKVLLQIEKNTRK